MSLSALTRFAFQPRRALSRYAIVGIWLLMAAVYAVLTPTSFLQPGTLLAIFGSQQALAFLAIGALCTLVVGEIDLSIASILGLAATIVPVLYVYHGWNLAAACVVALAACALAGLVNGLITVKIGVDAIIATLGTGTLLLGISSLISRQTTVAGLPAEFSRIALLPIGGMPISFFYGLALAIICTYVLTKTPLGQHVAFVGSNPDVARLAGVNVQRIRAGGYVAGAVIAGLGGIVMVAAVGGYDSTTSPNFLLPTFAAAFLGTAVVRPGKFNPIGTLVGIYFLATGILGLQLLGFSGWIENAFYGATLVIAVSISAVVRRRSSS